MTYYSVASRSSMGLCDSRGFTLRNINLPRGLDVHVREHTLGSEAELAPLTVGSCSD